MLAANLLQEGKGVREVARLLNVNSSSVCRWKQALENGGKEALKARPHPGQKPKMTQEQKAELETILLQGALAAGFPTDLWTLSRVAKVIERRFGVAYHPGHVWYILRGLGWSAQKPERRARERDEEAIEAWRKHDWPRIKKKGAKDAGALS